MINIQSLFDKKRARQNHRLAMFLRLLKKCHHKIKMASQIERTNCIYTIPCLIVGMPMYSVGDCREYMTSQLVENGFIVEALSVDNLYISWEHHDSE